MKGDAAQKVLVLAAIVVVAVSAVVLGSWLVSGCTRESGSSDVRGSTKSSAPADDDTGGEKEGRLTRELQEDQNFFRALGEGAVRRLDVTATDFQPVGKPDSSYLYSMVATTDNAETDATIVMRYSGGLWRISDVRLKGPLAGGTDLEVPASFEDDMERELLENQHFLRKTAEGRLKYIRVDAVDRMTEDETVLTGEVGSVGGNTWPVEMRLRKSHGLWHMVNIRGLKGTDLL